MHSEIDYSTYLTQISSYRSLNESNQFVFVDFRFVWVETIGRLYEK